MVSGWFESCCLFFHLFFGYVVLYYISYIMFLSLITVKKIPSLLYFVWYFYVVREVKFQTVMYDKIYCIVLLYETLLLLIFYSLIFHCLFTNLLFCCCWLLYLLLNNHFYESQIFFFLERKINFILYPHSPMILHPGLKMHG